MEQDHCANIRIKEEPLDTYHTETGIQNIAIKQEPLSPVRCSHHPTPSKSPLHFKTPQPATQSLQPLQTPSEYISSTTFNTTPQSSTGTLHDSSPHIQAPASHSSTAPLGRFSHNRTKTDKTVDLSTYRFGLYSYYAEGNREEFDAPHFDPYYTENDIKDPALLARAKRYFQNLRKEVPEYQEEYEMRGENGLGVGRKHLPMYQRKRKKVKKLVVLVDNVPLSHSMKEFLLTKYPPDSDRTSRWAMRQSERCKNEFASKKTQSQESKLQEFLLQFQPGENQRRPKPYSHANKPDLYSNDDTLTSGTHENVKLQTKNNPSKSPKTRMSSSPSQADDSDESDQNISYLSPPHAPLAPPESLIEDPVTHVNNEIKTMYDALMKPTTSPDSVIQPPKTPPQSCDYSLSLDYSMLGPPSDAFVKQEPVEMQCEHVLRIKQEPIDPLTQVPPHRASEHCSSSHQSPTHNTPPSPTLQIKQEMLDSCDAENVAPNFPVITNVAPNIPVITTPAPPQKPVRKKKKVFHPFETVKEEQLTVEEHQNKDCTDNEIQQTDSAPSKTDPHNAHVQIKQEVLDPEHLKMVEIFRKRVQKLRKIEVIPFSSNELPIKEEPIEFEELVDDSTLPQIKVEPEEPTLLVFDPKPPVSRKSKTLKFVYGKRMNRASMKISRPNARLDNESEFDNAAKLNTPFSPPKSAWSQPEAVKEPVKDQLTAEIDKLIHDSNIESIDDTEKICKLFAETITTVTDTKTNVFNLVLEKFRKSKQAEEQVLDEGSEESQKEPAETNDDSQNKIQVLFPMSDKELFNEGLKVVSETKEPGNFEPAKIKVEKEDCPTGETEVENESSDKINYPEKQSSDQDQQQLLHEEIVIENNEHQDHVHHEEVIDSSNKLPVQQTPDKDHSTILKDTDKAPEVQVCHPATLPVKQNPYKPEFYTALHGEPVYNSGTSPTPSATLSQKSQPPSRKPSSEAERLFDEMMAEEQVSTFHAAEEQPSFHSTEVQPPFHTQENSYLEPFPRNDHLFPTSSLDDFIKAPLSTNEHLVKPKPSYVRLNYHETQETSEINKPPTILFSSNPEDVNPKDTPEWHNWHRQHERFDQFQNSGWNIEEQGSWSPQHTSWNDSCFEQPSSSSSSFEEQKDTGRIINYNSEQNSLSSWIESRRLSQHSNVHGHSNMAYIERIPSGEEIIRIPVEQRSVQTQHPSTNKFCPTFEAFLPYVIYVAQRQEHVKNVGTQANIAPSYPRTWISRQHQPRFIDNRSHSPQSSVLVEPLLNSRRLQVHSQKEATGMEFNSLSEDKIAIQQRHIQTQYPDNKRIYSEFEASVPFIAYLSRRTDSVHDCWSQTKGAPLFPPWVPPRRNRRHRPVLVEPLPNIEPIGDNVRTMRSSESYGILMEQIRTSNDPMFDMFMNFQNKPNGLVSKFNKYACYSPQANIPELPLTVNKNYTRKINTIGPGRGKRPGIQYKEITPQRYPPLHSNRGLTPYQISVKIRKMGQVDNIIGRLSNKKRKDVPDVSPKRVAR